MKRIVLCADDYGQAPAISEGILALLVRQRLSAVSCMVNSKFWPDYAVKLKPFHGQADIGLHFNLTEGQPLSSDYRVVYGDEFPSLASLIFNTHLNSIQRDVIEAELHAQLDAFAAALGFLPDYIDGHQHVHHLPVVRRALVAVYQDRLKNNQSYIRVVNVALRWRDIFSKQAVIYATGVKALRELLDQQAIPYNTTFSGIYGFDQAHPYREYFQHFLTQVTDGGLIMCHPGLAPSVQPDKIGHARFCEYKYLASQEFEADLASQDAVLHRFVLQA